MTRLIGPIAAALIALALLASASLYTVDQRQNAMVFQLGEVKDVVTTPGLHFKWPLIQNIRYFDTRILSPSVTAAEGGPAATTRPASRRSTRSAIALSSAASWVT